MVLRSSRRQRNFKRTMCNGSYCWQRETAPLVLLDNSTPTTKLLLFFKWWHWALFCFLDIISSVAKLLTTDKGWCAILVPDHCDGILRVVAQSRFKIGAAKKYSSCGGFAHYECRISRVTPPSFALHLGAFTNAQLAVFFIRRNSFRFVNAGDEETDRESRGRRRNNDTLIQSVLDPVQQRLDSFWIRQSIVGCWMINWNSGHAESAS